MRDPYDDLVPGAEIGIDPYADLAPSRASTISGGAKLALASQAAGAERLAEEAPVLGAFGQAVARGGKVLLGAAADLATTFPGGPEPSVENLRSFARAPSAPMPVEEGLAEMRGLGSIPTKMAAGLIRAVPAIGASAGLAGLGVPAPLAAAMPMSADETGVLQPGAAVVGAVLPAAAAMGERAVAGALSRLPVKEVAMVISRDPYRLKGKIVQKFGPVDLADDTVRQWLEAGGGAAAANAVLLASQAPDIMALPEEQQGEAILDAVAAGIGPSLLGFAARRPVSLTLDRMAPDILAQARQAFGPKPPGGATPPPPPSDPSPAPPRGSPPAPPAPPPRMESAETHSAPSAPPPVAGLAEAARRLGEMERVPPPETFGPGARGEVPEPRPTLQVPPDLAERLRAARRADEAAFATPEPQPSGTSGELPPPPSLNGGDIIANWTRNELLAGRKVDHGDVVAKGGELGLDAREAEEWAELGSTEQARAIAVAEGMTNRQKFDALVSLYDRMPGSSTRTTETRVNQQYSTPPPLAFVGSVLANFGSGKHVADLTAGHGMLAIGAPSGAFISVNELDSRRHARLARFLRTGGPFGGVALTGADATSPEFLDSLRANPPDRLGLNPPFGSKLGPDGRVIKFPIRNATSHADETTSIDVAIALNALDAAAPGVEAFLIIGAKTGTPFAKLADDPKHRAEDYRKPVFLDLFNRFNVVDWFTVGGDLYRRMGAGWPVDVIVVRGKHGTLPSSHGGLVRPWIQPPRVLESWDELRSLIPPEEKHEQTQTTQRPAAPHRSEPAGSGNGPGHRGGDAGGRSDAGPGATAVSRPRPERQPRPSRGGSGGASPSPDQPRPSGGGVGGRPSGGGGTPGISQGPGGPAVPRARSSEAGGVAGRWPEPVGQPRQSSGLTEALLVPYAGASRGPSLSLKAPRNMADAMLAAQRAMETEVGMSLDQFVADRLHRDVATLHQQLAGAQIDALALAIRNIERGTGFITADETGVGKGRVVAGLIEYALGRGLVPVFVTAKKNLYGDMVGRDMVAVGNPDLVPFITDAQFYYVDGRGKEIKGRGSAKSRAAEMEAIVRTGQLPGGARAVFTTYAQLGADRMPGWKEDAKQKFGRKANRMAKPDGPRWAMLRALAPRAIFILDESHLAAGKDSEVNIQFESVLPQARGVYYSSATFAKRFDTMGLYAVGTGMKLAGLDGEALGEALVAGGVPLQQALTSMLAASGELVRRQQDWDGVEMQFKTTGGDASREAAAADTYTAFIRDLMLLAKQVNGAAKGLENAENQVRAEEETVAVEAVNFGSRLFNLSNQYLFALRAAAVTQQAIDELKAGRKPFIAVANTMEGPMQDLLAMRLPLSFSGVLVREMRKMLTLTVRDPMADGGKREVQLRPDDLPDGGEYFKALAARILDTDLSGLPISPIDAIKAGIAKAGWKVGELTGRKTTVAEGDDGEDLQLTKREQAELAKVLAAYNDGDLDVLVVNGAADTGLSAHSDPRFKDQRQRAMIVGQPAPDINKFMQMLGRVMRSGQTSKPVYRIISTSLAAERRFATMLRGKMASLNANTTAESESGMTQSAGFQADVFNAVGDRVVLDVLQANPGLVEMMGLGELPEDPDENFARWATGRFVLLPNADAHKLWIQIERAFIAEIEELDEAGTNPLKAAAEDLGARTIETTVMVGGTGKTPFDGPALLERAVVRPSNAVVTHAVAEREAQEGRPQTRAEAMAWIEASKVAEREQLDELARKGATDAQIERAKSNFDRSRHAVADAFRTIGNTYGVDVMETGEASFHGVPVGLKLAGSDPSDFSSASRQRLVLRTNTFKGKLSIALSKLSRKDGGSMLLEVAEDEAPAVFDSNAETKAERYIVSGNLLRGWAAANQQASGRGMGKPRVAIYTRDTGDLATGVLMPAGWAPGLSAEQPITTAEEFVAAVGQGKTAVLKSGAGSSVNPVAIREDVVTVPSSMIGRPLWGDPAFNGFFSRVPTQGGGNFVGLLRPEMAGDFFRFLWDRGVRLVVVPPPDPVHAEARGAFVTVYGRGPAAAPTTIPVRFGAMHLVRPVELPELVRLARGLAGAVPKVARVGPKSMGAFQAGPGGMSIRLDPRIFADPELAARVLAHEIGHLADYLPDHTLTRGNLLGHLGALRNYLRRSLRGFGAAEIRTELLDLTRWWRPYDPRVDPKSYVAYRETPEELYADALSVLFNAPEELQRRAPRFYEAFWKNVDARPTVRDSLFAIQSLLGRGKAAVLEARAADLHRMFQRGEETWQQMVDDRRRAAESWDGWWDSLGQEMLWTAYPLERRADAVAKRGVDIPERLDPRNFMDDLGFRDVRVMRFGRTVWEKVIQPVEASGMTLDDLGQYLFLNRVLGDRASIANPGGMTPDAARLGLLRLRLDLGGALPGGAGLRLDRWSVLQAAASRFHAEVFKIAQEAVEVGAYSRQVFKSVIVPNQATYATFAVVDYLQDHLPAQVIRQYGTLSDVANPVHATIIKSMAVLNLIAFQRAKNGTVEFLNRYFPTEIATAGEREVSHPPKGRGVLMRLENGKPAHYLVDPYIAEMFTEAPPRQLWWLTRVADMVFRKFFYPFIITYNPMFLMVRSPIMDWQRTGRNLPGHFQRVRILRDYFGTLPEVWRRYWNGEAGPTVREMEANLGLGTPFDQMARAHRDDFLGDLLRRMRVLPDHEQQGVLKRVLWRPARAVLDTVEAIGLTLDATTKVAAFRRLVRAGWHPRKAARWVRNNAGLPNINKKGKLTRTARAFVPFINPAIQGWRADLRLMTEPQTRGGWWMKYLLSNGWMRVVLALGAAGVFGPALKELFDAISEYRKTNGLAVPLGSVPGGEFGKRTLLLSIPETHTDRLFGALISKAIRAAGPDDLDLQGIVDLMGGQLPTVNPAFSVPRAWYDVARGRNPQDYRGADVVPYSQWTAGGVNVIPPMVKWTLREMGLGHAGGLVSVTDQGYRERQVADIAEADAAREMERLKLSPEVRSLGIEYNRLARLGTSRTAAQETRFRVLSGWHSTVYAPAWETLREGGAVESVADATRRSLATQSQPYVRR